MAYTAGGYDSDVEGGPYQENVGMGFTDKAVSWHTFFNFNLFDSSDKLQLLVVRHRIFSNYNSHNVTE